MRIFMTMIALCLAPPAVAQTRTLPQNCIGTKAALPPELSEWSSGVPLAAAPSIAGVDRTALVLGKTALLRLVPTPAVQFALPPKKPATLAGHGGLASFTISRSGIYRVALGSVAWVDVLQGGKALAAAAHEHGPACSGIRKIVNFQLRPGRYLLQIAGNAEPIIPVMISPSG